MRMIERTIALDSHSYHQAPTHTESALGLNAQALLELRRRHFLPAAAAGTVLPPTVNIHSYPVK
jgi:hypothetical protein